MICMLCLLPAICVSMPCKCSLIKQMDDKYKAHNT